MSKGSGIFGARIRFTRFSFRESLIGALTLSLFGVVWLIANIL